MKLQFCMICITVVTISCNATTKISQLLRKQETKETCPKVLEIVKKVEVPVIKEVIKEIPVVKEIIKEVEVIKECPSDITKDKNSASDRLSPAVPVREPSQLGFMVELSEHTSVGHKGTITYDHVLIDDGNNFVPLLGTFRCPDNAIYMMYWSVEAKQGRVQASLVMQGEQIKYGPLTKDILSTFSGTSTMASVVQCYEGASIWVKALSWPDPSACSQVESIYSSITGIKIFQDDEEASAFTVELSENTTASTLIYDRIIMNIGDDYHKETGQYICPKTGTYIFIVSQHITGSAGGFNCRIQKNNADQCEPTYLRHTSTETATSTGSCVVQCNQNDIIHIVCNTATHLALASSFSGFFLNVPTQEQRAFSASLLASDARSYQNGQILIFNDVLNNIGGGYKSNLGSYVCDDSGLYLFYVSIVPGPENDQRAGELMILSAYDQNETILKQGPRTSEALNDNYVPLSSMHIVVRCKPEMAVYVKAVVPNGGNPLQYYTTYTTFGGFMLPTV